MTAKRPRHCSRCHRPIPQRSIRDDCYCRTCRRVISRAHASHRRQALGDYSPRQRRFPEPPWDFRLLELAFPDPLRRLVRLLTGTAYKQPQSHAGHPPLQGKG